MCNIKWKLQNVFPGIYPNIRENYTNPDWLAERAILSPLNKDVDALNDIVLNCLPGAEVLLTSTDSNIAEDDAVRYPTEVLNKMNPAGYFMSFC